MAGTNKVEASTRMGQRRRVIVGPHLACYNQVSIIVLTQLPEAAIFEKLPLDHF